jgi:hypothetical protein
MSWPLVTSLVVACLFEKSGAGIEFECLELSPCGQEAFVFWSDKNIAIIRKYGKPLISECA